MIEIVLQLLLVILVLCLTIFYFYLRRAYGYWKDRGIPYEKPTLFVGNLGHLMRTSMWDYMYNLAKKHQDKDYIGLFMGWKPALVINSKEIAKKIFVKEFDSFQNRYSYAGKEDDPLGALNLFTVKNPTWIAMRQELAPVFTSHRLKGITDLMNVNSAELVGRIETDFIKENKTVNLKNLFSMYTSDIVGHTIFGMKVSSLKDTDSPLWFITQHLVDWTFYRGFEFSIILFAPAVAGLMRLKFFSEAATKYITKLFWDVADKRKGIDNLSDKDFINDFLKIREKLKLSNTANVPGSPSADDLMMAQVAVFILGSIETSSTALCYLVIELAQHPEIQEKLYNEISNAVKTKGTDTLDFYNLLELNYLSACMKETLRKYPTLSFLDRVCNKTCQLTDELTVEEGTPVFINLQAIHYNEEYYPEPKEWRPERFLGSADNDNRDFTFLTFGDGPRFCIGKRYGLLQIRTAIVRMMMKFRFVPEDNYVAETDPYCPILSIKDGGKIKFVAR